MRGFGHFIGIVLLAAALIGGFFVYAAHADQALCSIQATLSAQGAGSQEFLFTGFADGNPIPPFTLVDGQSTGGTIPEGIVVAVSEEPQAGWIFGGIVCDAGPGIVIVNNNQGFTIQCVNAIEGEAVCTIVNVLESRPIPTLSDWGMISATVGLGFIGVFFTLRKRRAALSN